MPRERLCYNCGINPIRGGKLCEDCKLELKYQKVEAAEAERVEQVIIAEQVAARLRGEAPPQHAHVSDLADWWMLEEEFNPDWDGSVSS